MLIVFLPQYRWTLLRTRRPAVQIGRSVLMLVSNLVFVMAIGRVPLATASAIGFTSPLIVTALSVPLLHESVGWRRWSAVLVGFAGALMVIRPGSGFQDPAVLLLLASALAYALYQIATRWVGRYDSAATGIIFAALLGSLAMSLVLPFVFVMPRTLLDALLFCSLGLLGGVRTLSDHPRLPARAGRGDRAARLCRTGRHVDAWLSDLRQFPRSVDVGWCRRDHRVRHLRRVPRAAAAGAALSRTAAGHAAPTPRSLRRSWCSRWAPQQTAGGAGRTAGASSASYGSACFHSRTDGSL